MNQILDTGEEQFKNNNINYGNYNQNKKQKVYKEKSVIEINKIVIFFAISILILGICIIAGSIYAKDKINKNNWPKVRNTTLAVLVLLTVFFAAQSPLSIILQIIAGTVVYLYLKP